MGGVGYGGLHQALVDDCNPTQHGAFILVAPQSPLQGLVEGAHLLDIAPTLLELGGYDVPANLPGRSLVAGLEANHQGGTAYSDLDEQAVRERLSGLGYLG
jgi:hypothetical protein